MKKIIVLVLTLMAIATATAEDIGYAINDAGWLQLIIGDFSKDRKWLDDVTPASVTKVTASDEVNFVGDCSGLFAEFSNCTSMDLNDVNTANCTNMNSMFGGCSSLTTLNIGSWDTGNVVSMSRMFGGCTSLTTLDLGMWNTEKVGYMTEMFYGCTNLTTLDLLRWKTPLVVSMSEMFSGCTSLTTIYAGDDWSTEYLSASTGMFHDCNALKGGMGTTLDANHLDAEYARLDHGERYPGYFTGLYELELPYDVKAMPDAPVTHDGMSYYVAGTTITLSCNEEVPDGQEVVYKLNGTIIEGDTFVMPFGDVGVSAYIEEIPPYRFYSETGKLALLKGELNKNNKWDDDLADAVTSVTATDQVSFRGDCSALFYNCKNCTSIDLSNVNTENLTSMEEMFYGCENLETLNLSGWNTSNVIDMGGLFYGCTKLETLDLSGFNTSKVEVMGSMFAGCGRLSSIDLSGWDTGNVADMNAMFAGCESLHSLNSVTGWNTSNVKGMISMFSECQNLMSLDLSKWDTGNVIRMTMMFNGCSCLNSLNVSGFKTGNVVNMGSMFMDCPWLNSLDLSKWDTSNVTDMTGMFMNCTNLATLDLSGWTLGEVNMSTMFQECSNLTTIYAGAGWNTSNAEGMVMFANCEKLVGGKGTTYSQEHMGIEYARIDKGEDDPGYLTGAFTITQPEGIAHGKVNMLADGNTLSSGDVVVFGTTVTLAVIPDEGYELEALIVTTPDEASGAALLAPRRANVDYTQGDLPGTYSFEMPDAPVTVNATFKEKEPTAINSVVSDPRFPLDGRRYNILGQPVGPDYKGVVIRNGKKIVIK